MRNNDRGLALDLFGVNMYSLKSCIHHLSSKLCSVYTPYNNIIIILYVLFEILSMLHISFICHF